MSDVVITPDMMPNPAAEKDVTPSAPVTNVPAAVVVPFNKNGIVDFKDQNGLASAAKLLIQIKLVPDELSKHGVNAIMSALTLCKQFKLPYSAMNEMGYIKGKVGVYGSLMTALAQRHPDYGELSVYYLDPAQEMICMANKNLKEPVWACVVRVRKKGHDDWNEYFFTMDEAKTAGLLSNNNYNKYAKDMLWHKAKNRALRTEYSSALHGVESYEEMMFDDLANKARPVDQLNERLGLSQAEQKTE